MTDFLLKAGTAIILAASTDHSPAARNNLGTRTAQIDLTSLVNGAHRQSAKIDFGGGTVNWARQWEMTAAIEPVSAPSANTVCRFYIGYSDSATAGTGNPGNLSGTDSAWTGWGSTAAHADDAVPDLVEIGILTATAHDAIFVANVGIFVPRARYGCVVTKNVLGVDLEGDAVEMSIRVKPLVDTSV